MHNLTLSMIVKNESSNIERCLLSLAPYIDYYIICDTGSTDDTKEKIKQIFDAKGIEGEIHDHEWEDFGTNRTKALELTYGKTKWAIMIDADDSISGNFPVSQLSDKYDAYNVILTKEGFKWSRTQIFNISKKEWKYEEPLHEYPICEGKSIIGDLNGDYIWEARIEGCRSKESSSVQEKYKKDYWTLKSYLKKDPNQPRKQFYAAQSAFDGGMIRRAEEEYQKVLLLDGWIEEKFYSWLRIGQCREALGKPIGETIDAYMMAYEISPDRVEPLCHMSRLYRNNNRPVCAYLVAKAGLNIKFPTGKLFINSYEYLVNIYDEIASTAYSVGEWVIGAEMCEKLLSESFLPEQERERVARNHQLYLEEINKSLAN